MYQRLFSLVSTVVLGAVIAPSFGCGDNLGASSVAPGGERRPDAGLPPDAELPPDAAPVTCTADWKDLQIGTDLDDQLWGMALDDKDNLFVAGYEQGITGVTNIEPDGNARAVLARLDPAGAVQWKAVLETSGTDTLEDVKVEVTSGTLYAVGRTSGAFEGFTNQGQFDGFLVALDKQGERETLFQWGDERPAHPTRLSLGPGQDLAVAGYDDTYVPDGELGVVSRERGFVSTFDRGGSPAAAFRQTLLKKADDRTRNYITDVVVDRDGSGSMYISSMITSGRVTGMIVQKLMPDGTVVWSQQLTRVFTDALNAVALSPSGELYVAGATGALLGSQAFGEQDAVVVKLDKATGSTIWAAQAGGVGSDWPTSLAFDQEGNIYIAGLSTASVVDGQPYQGAFDIFAMKFDEKGSLVSSWQAGTPDVDWATSMVVDSCGRVLVGGYTKGDLVRSAQGSAGGFDMFVVRAQL